eukprot:403363779
MEISTQAKYNQIDAQDIFKGDAEDYINETKFKFNGQSFHQDSRQIIAEDAETDIDEIYQFAKGLQFCQCHKDQNCHMPNQSQKLVTEIAFDVVQMNQYLVNLQSDLTDYLSTEFMQESQSFFDTQPKVFSIHSIIPAQLAHYLHYTTMPHILKSAEEQTQKVLKEDGRLNCMRKYIKKQALERYFDQFVEEEEL